MTHDEALEVVAYAKMLNIKAESMDLGILKAFDRKCVRIYYNKPRGTLHASTGSPRVNFNPMIFNRRGSASSVSDPGYEYHEFVQQKDAMDFLELLK